MSIRVKACPRSIVSLRTLLFFPLVFLYAHLAGADISVSIGTASLTLPVPEGYQALPLDKQEIAAVVEKAVPTAGTTNTRLAFLVLKADLDADRGNADARSIDFQTMRESFTKNLSRDYFEGEKKLLRAQAGAFMEKAKGRVAELSKAGTYGTNPESESTSMSLFIDTERVIGMSTVWKMAWTDESGRRQTQESVVTVCLMLLKGKALFFYVRGTKDELAWTQAEARKMAEQLIALNPSSWVEAQNEKTGLDTQKIIDAGIKGSKLPTTWTELGALVGVIAVVLGWFYFKRRTAKVPPVIKP